MKRLSNCRNLPIHPLRLWLEQYWQPALWAEDVDSGCLAAMMHQAPPLVIRHPFIYTLGAVETVGFLFTATPRQAKKLGVGCRCH